MKTQQRHLPNSSLPTPFLMINTGAFLSGSGLCAVFSPGNYKYDKCFKCSWSVSCLTYLTQGNMLKMEAELSTLKNPYKQAGTTSPHPALWWGSTIVDGAVVKLQRSTEILQWASVGWKSISASPWSHVWGVGYHMDPDSFPLQTSLSDFPPYPQCNIS